jgi:sulfite exporter TauE/SafE
MPIDLIALGAAFVSGLLGGVHCIAMCGGIATGFGLATGGPGARPGFAPALRVNLGRVAGYTLAGAVVGGLGGGLLQLARVDGLATAARMALGAVLIVVALRLLDTRGRLGFLQRPGAALWRLLAPLQRRLVPANTVPRQLALGLLWGWLPCGLSTTLLFAAWLEADARHGALLMASFGLGTLPVMLPLTWSGARLGRWIGRREVRVGAALLLLVAGLATALAPWLAGVPAVHELLVALGCRSLPA